MNIEIPNDNELATKNPFSKKHFNMTYQCYLMQKNPTLAKQLEAQAKGKEGIQKQLTGLFTPGDQVISWPELLDRMAAEHGQSMGRAAETLFLKT